MIDADEEIGAVGMDDAPVTIDDSVTGLCKVVWFSPLRSVRSIMLTVFRLTPQLVRRRVVCSLPSMAKSISGNNRPLRAENG